MKSIFFFVTSLREEGNITRSRLVLRSPSNSSFNREVIVVFLQQWRLVSIDNEEYIEELKDKSENKNTEQHGVVKERFQKVGESKKLTSKFRRVRERFARPTIVAVSVKDSAARLG